MSVHNKDIRILPDPERPSQEFGLDIPIFAKLYDFYIDLSQTISAFPKTKRYSLGQKLDSLTLKILELLLSVPAKKDKIPTLGKISVKLDLLKILVRIAKDTQALTNKNYLGLQTRLNEIGKMLGGWIRASKNY